MKLTYIKDKSFEFESKYVEIHVKVYKTIPPSDGIITRIWGDLYCEFDVSIFELIDQEISIDHYTLSKYPELKGLYPYKVRIVIESIKLYDCDDNFKKIIKSLINQYQNPVGLRKIDFLFDLSYDQKDFDFGDMTMKFINCLFTEYEGIGFDFVHGNYIQLLPDWYNMIYN